VAGAEFELSLLAEVVGLPVDDTLDVLDSAIRARLVAEVPGEPGRYGFVHAIVRDSLASSLTETRRTRIHELLAERLETRAATDPDRWLVALARHALEAAVWGGDPERAAELAARAADRAGAVLAYEDAARLLRRAVNVLERRGGSAESRAELLCSLAEALGRAASPADARAVLSEAKALARVADRSDLIARVALATGGTGVTILGTDQQLVSELEQSLDAVGSSHPALRVRLLARLAIELAYEQDSSRREAVSSQALQSARRLDDPAALAAALNARHVALWGPDHGWERLRGATEMLELARRAQSPELACRPATGAWSTCSGSATGERCTTKSTRTPSSQPKHACQPTAGTCRCGARPLPCSRVGSPKESRSRVALATSADRPATRTPTCSSANIN
jgi:hypothetical protein